MSITTGDVVILNSGGVRMTVQHVNGDLIDCAWSDANSVPQTGRYHVSMLHKLPKLSDAEIVKLIVAAF